MKSRELNELSIQELEIKGNEIQQELFNIKFQLHTGRLENTAKVKSLKRDFARFKTMLREKRGQ
jgi:large subunit ribosomal protein L29